MSDPRTRRASYCRRQAFKQAHSIMSMGNLLEALEEELKQDKQSSIRVQPKDLKLKDGDSHKPKHTKHKGPKSPNATGAGHDGQAGGAGVLPISSSLINIHSHLVGRDSTDDSTSYIYADEDAEHHQLPEYQDHNEYSKTKSGNSPPHKAVKNKNNDDLVLPDDDYVYGDKITETNKMLAGTIEMNEAKTDVSDGNSTGNTRPSNAAIPVKQWNDDDDQSKASDLSNNNNSEEIQVVYKNDDDSKE